MLHALALSVVFGAVSNSDRLVLATKLAEVLSTGEYKKTKVYVGSLPPGAKLTIPLPAFTLLGTVAEIPLLNEAGTSTVSSSANSSTVVLTPNVPDYTLYYELPSNNRTALDRYASALTQAGWREEDFMRMFEDAEQSQGGFVVQPPRTRAFPHYYCKGQNAVAVQRWSSMPQVIAIAASSGRQAASFCAMSELMKAMPRPPKPPQLPTLQAPPQVTMEASSGTGYNPDGDSSAALTTALPLSSVGPAFAQQLNAVGWQGDAPAQSPTAYVQTFHRVNSGRHFQLVLSIVSAGKPDHYDANLSESDADAPTASLWQPFHP